MAPVPESHDCCLCRCSRAATSPCSTSAARAATAVTVYAPVDAERASCLDVTPALLRHGDNELMVAHLAELHDKPRESKELSVLHRGQSATSGSSTSGGPPRAPVRAASGGAHRRFFFDGRPYLSYSWNMGAAGTGAVRFVGVEPQCCCDGHCRTTCARSRFFFTLTTWTMTLSLMDKPMTWMKDGVLHCEELWVLPAYEGLPQVTVESPMVTFDDPDVVCFVVCERDYVKFSDRKVWIVEVDTMSKELRSVVPYTTGGQPENLVPVNLL
ncbi:hypothetical protein SETIT_J028000v2 [Setaria italica]|uniref:DUF1618 domain-containing protein n=1 Tax=Setaria italica TaxID=4555 RepID=K3Z2X8_SETIT|nr:hypothetical protein SETIT_J028000v2 [Setaria italica]